MSESLPQRMREAAKVLREASERTPDAADSPGYWSWTPQQLEKTAINWEERDEKLADELARFMVAVQAANYPSRADLRDPECTKARGDAMEIARCLVAAGWTKRVAQ